MILPSKLADEEASQDDIYDDLPPLEKGYNDTRFYNAEDSDGEYCEFPFNSDPSRNDPSIKDKKRFTCLLCSRYFRNIHCFKLHVYWHTDCLANGTAPLSDTSEDIPILSSGEEIVTQEQDTAAECTCGTSHQLTVNDFECVYGHDFIHANQTFVENVLIALNQHKSEFESQVSEEKSGNSHTSTTGQDEEVQEVYINTGADYEAITDHYLQIDDAHICEKINNQVIYDDDNTNDKNN